MSTKKQHLYNMAWWQLCAAHNNKPGRVTAGEFARVMGISRSTAKRWLTEMMMEGGCTTENFNGKNGMLAQAWIPVGFKAWQDQQKYIEQED